jgi:tetratricopeptide (TPR) repeat protein
MVDELVAQLAVEPIDVDIQRQIVDHAGGNPLFAEQLLAFAADAPGLPLENPPPNVEALLASRLDRLEPRPLALLRRAAVLGRSFSSAQLEDLGGDPDVGRLLQSLTERRFVRPLREVFRFHHVLVRDVAYRGIPKAERAALHEQAARGLDRRDGADEIVGYHFEQAYRYLTEIRRVDAHAHALAKAGGEFLGRAGIRAWKRADAPAAVSLLRRTLVLTPNAGDLACELALALNVRGERARAQDLLTDVAEQAGEQTRLRAELEGAFLRSLGEPDRAGELLEAATAAIPILEQAGDDRGLGRAWYCVAYVRGGFYCEYAAMEEAAERVGTYYSRGGWSTSAAAEMLGLALYFGPRPVDEAIARLDQLSGEGSGDRAGEANSALWRGGLESMRCNFDLARAHVARARSLYLDLGLTTAAVDLCGRALAAIELLAGFPEVAERALREACARLQEVKETAVLATRAAELAAAIYERGLYDEAAVWAGLARESAGADDLDAALTRQPVEAKILARLGDMAEAERLARVTLSLVARTDALNRHADALLALAEVLDLAGSEREAQESAHQALVLYERKGNAAAAARVRTRLAGVIVSP